PPPLHSFPTRRSSDLSVIPIAAAPEAAVELNRESTTRSRTEGEQRALPKRDENAHRPIAPLAMDCGCSVWDDWCSKVHFFDSNRSEEHTSELQSQSNL